MRPPERGEAFDDWYNGNDVLVLIATYSLNLAGLNGQKSCCTVLLLEPSWNVASEKQAFTRVYRFGQDEDVNVFRYHVRNSFMGFHMSRMHDKAMAISVAMGAVHRAMTIEGMQGGDVVNAMLGGNVPKEIEEHMNSRRDVSLFRDVSAAKQMHPDLASHRSGMWKSA